MSQTVQELLNELQNGSADAWFSLAELDPSYIPELIEAYRASGDPEMRLSLIEIIWQHHADETLNFFIEVFRDENPEIWKAALDGFFAVDPSQALQALGNEKERYKIDPVKNRERLEWLDEAAAQLTAKRLA